VLKPTAFRLKKVSRRSVPSGQRPSLDAMIVDCAYYARGVRQSRDQMTLEEAASCPRGGGNYVWIELDDPSPGLMTGVSRHFGLHELAVEDAQTFHMRPKIEAYDQDVRLVILRTARYDNDAEEVEFGEISVFLAPTFVITVRQGVASELRGARRRLEQRQCRRLER